MKAAQLRFFGVPHEVVDCIDTADVGAPGDDELVVDVLACPINPADLLMIEGKYASKPDLPARLGIEGAGRVSAAGAAVEGLAEGDLVMSLARANWVQRLKLKAGQVVKAPAGIDVRQLAMLKANPATAWLMLKNYVALEAGDWVIQNAANSAVGTNLILLAKAEGLRSVNVVRRDSLIGPLKALGADCVVVDGDDLAARVREATDGAEIRLAIDAVAGTATLRLADCLAEGGTVVNYGLLSGQPCMLGAEQTIFKGITLTGFWLAKLMRDLSQEALETMYATLMARISDGTLKVNVEACYALDEVRAALKHAAREGRGGKILLTPNGPVA